jgi:hypothetical protein
LARGGNAHQKAGYQKGGYQKDVHYRRSKNGYGNEGGY